jgi:hypothetical protein
MERWTQRATLPTFLRGSRLRGTREADQPPEVVVLQLQMRPRPREKQSGKSYSIPVLYFMARHSDEVYHARQLPTRSGLIPSQAETF